MATKFEHVKATCPFCSWCRRSFYLPDHLITHHANEIRIRSTTNEHCVYAYVLDKKREIGFCVCLTCRKGIMEDGFTSQGSRWASTHSNKSECKKHHRVRLAEFKTLIGLSVSVGPSEIPVHIPIPSSTNDVSTLWDTLKSNPRFSCVMKGVEQDCTDTHDEDLGEFTFDPKLGFGHILEYALGYKKKYESYDQEREGYKKERINLEQEYEKELLEMRNDIMALKDEIRCLRRDNSDQTHEIDELRARVTMLERQNKRYKEACPSLVTEDPQ